MPIYEDEIRKDSFNNDSGVISNDLTEQVESKPELIVTADPGYHDPELDTEDQLDLSKLESERNKNQKLRVAEAFRHLLKAMLECFIDYNS